jgi:hypothetical protein
VHALKIAQQLFDDPPLGPNRDTVNHLDQELDQAVDDLLPTLPAKRPKQRVADSLGVHAHLARRLGGGP